MCLCIRLQMCLGLFCYMCNIISYVTWISLTDWICSAFFFLISFSVRSYFSLSPFPESNLPKSSLCNVLSFLWSGLFGVESAKSHLEPQHFGWHLCHLCDAIRYAWNWFIFAHAFCQRQQFFLIAINKYTLIRFEAPHNSILEHKLCTWNEANGEWKKKRNTHHVEVQYIVYSDIFPMCSAEERVRTNSCDR